MMKKISIAIMLIIASLESFCQSGSLSKTPEEYMRKGRTQKIVAWSMVAGGSAVAVIGAVTQINDIDKFFNASDKQGLSFYRGTGIFIVGLAVALTSIPFFVAGADNKYKAKRAARKAKTSFDIKQVKTIQSTGYAFTMQPTLSLKIRL